MSNDEINMGELYRLLTKLDARVEKIDEKVDAIVVQTTKTNGRVTTAEGEIVTLRSTVSRTAWAIVGMIITAATGAFVAWLK